MGGFARATAIGAASGMVGGGVGGTIGNNAIGAIAGGFSGGATGSYLSGKRGMDVVYGGLMGAGVAMAAYSAVWGYNNFSDIGQEQLESEFLREGSCSDCPMEPNGKQPITSSRKLVMDDFETFDAANPNKTESAAAYVARQSWLRGKLYVKRVWERYSPDQHSVSMDGAVPNHTGVIS